MSDQFDVKQYEFKSPCYALSDRNAGYDFKEEENKQKSRFYYDTEARCYKSKADKKDSISMMFAGDLLCQENMNSRYRTGENSFNYELCFDYVRPLFRSCDFAAGNLETPVAETAPYRGEIITHEGPYYCNAPIQYLEALKYAGFDMLTTANNHTIDAGARGIYETIKNVRKFDFIQTGTFPEPSEKYVIVDICGFKVGFTAFSLFYNSMEKNLLRAGKQTLLNQYSKDNAKVIYDKMKSDGAEYVVCFPHWGKEYTYEISERQRAVAEALTEIGYDFLVGSHAHFIQKFEYINGKPVLFGLGNLISHLNSSELQENTKLTIVCNLKLTRKENEIIPEIAFIPCQIFKNYHRIPYTVLLYNENMHYSGNAATTMKKSFHKYQEILEVSGEMICTNYAIHKDAVVEFKAKEERQEQLVSQLVPVQTKAENKGVTAEELLEREQKKFILPWKAREKYIVHQGNLMRVYDDHVVLSDFATDKTVVSLPDKVDGLPLTVVENRLRRNKSVRYLHLGKFVEIIEEKAFQNFEELESVRILGNLQIVKAKAFSNCPKLTGLIMPDMLKRIEAGAFEKCVNLRNLTLKREVEYIAPNAFKGCKNLIVFCYKESYAEDYCKKNKITHRRIRS